MAWLRDNTLCDIGHIRGKSVASAQPFIAYKGFAGYLWWPLHKGKYEGCGMEEIGRLVA
jgi:hypothetical protein